MNVSDSPLVSVVLPTYNRAHTLARAVRSVLNQTHRNLELIVVDDGSTDGTASVVEALKDSRVRYIRQRNAGPAAARNAGIRAARGELVAFQDSDDEWLDGKLERQVQALTAAGPDHVLCVCSYVISLETERPCAYHIGPERLVHRGDLRRQTLENFFFPTPTWLARSEALHQVGLFDETLGCWEDWELAIRLADAGGFVLAEGTLHLQHFKRSGVNSDELRRMKSMSAMLERHRMRWSATPRTLARHHYTVGRLQCLHGSVAEGREQFRFAVAADRGFRKAWLALVLASLGAPLLRRVVQLKRFAVSLRPEPESKRLGPGDLN